MRHTSNVGSDSSKFFSILRLTDPPAASVDLWRN